MIDSPGELANATYKSEWTQYGTAPLTDGDYREPAAPGSATETIDPRRTYALSTRITDAQGNLLYINTQSYPVLTQGNPTYNVEVAVEKVN